MKSPKEDYEIRKSVVSDPGTGEDLLIFLSFYTLVIKYVFISRSNKCTSKILLFKCRLPISQFSGSPCNNLNQPTL